MSTSRPICVMEAGYLTSGQCYIQMGIEVKDPSLVDKYTKRLFSMCTPFHIKADTEKMILTLEHRENKAYEMPETITKLDDAIKWSLENAKPNATNELATLSVNSKLMVYNVNHAFCDGGMFKQIFDELQNPDFKEPEIHLPLTFFTTFIEQIKTYEPHTLSTRNPEFTHMKPIKEDGSTYSDDKLELVFSQTEAKEVSNYENGHIHQLTAELTAAMILAAKALSGYNDGYGVQAAINVRRYMSEDMKHSWDLNFHAGNIGIDCKDPKTINDLIEGLDKKLKYELDNEEWLNHTAYLLLPLLHPDDKRYVNFEPYGLGLYLTQMGAFKSNGEITDLMINVNQEIPVECVVLQSYSFIRGNQNTLKNHIIFRRTGITAATAKKYLHLIDFCLKNMRREVKTAEFIEVLKQNVL